MLKKTPLILWGLVSFIPLVNAEKSQSLPNHGEKSPLTDNDTPTTKKKSTTSSSASQKKTESLEQLKKSIVSIRVDIPVAAYGPVGRFYGTGFVVNKKENIIATNAHIAGQAQICAQCVVTLHNGREVDAHILYIDPIRDLAFLKAKDMDSLGGEEVVFEKDTPTLGEKVTIIGKNENNHFSVQTGTIASCHEISGILPQQSLRVSLNAQGGASGSPIFNEHGKVIGIVFASDRLTSSFALATNVVLDSLTQVNNTQSCCDSKDFAGIGRFSLGAVLEYKSIDEWVRYCRFPDDEAKDYSKKFPDAFSRILVVGGLINDSPAQKQLHVGDVILKANDKEIGPNLYTFEKIIDEAGKNKKPITLDIMRMGKKQTLHISPYDLGKKEVTKILDFLGAFFFEADESLIHRMGPKDHQVFACNLKPSSPFTEAFPVFRDSLNTAVAVVEIDGKPIKSIEDMVNIIPKIMKKKDFFIKFQSFYINIGYNGQPSFNQNQCLATISYAPHYGVCQLFKRDDQYAWTIETIGDQSK
jgi:S1-C subfamily serine protease